MILRVALHDNLGKWLPGTVLEIYPNTHAFNWGDEAHFLLIRVRNEEVDDDFRKRVAERRVVLELEDILDETALKRHSNNLGKHKNDYVKTGKKPDFSNAVVLSEIRTRDPDSRQVVKKEHFVSDPNIQLESILRDRRGR